MERKSGSKGKQLIQAFSLHIDADRLKSVRMEDRLPVNASKSRAGLSRTLWSRLCRNKFALLAIVFILLTVLFALIGPLLSPYRYDQQIRGSENLLPNAQHWLGTDNFGRDLLTRLMSGTGISLLVGLFATTATIVIGSVYGAFSGMAGGSIDHLMMRFVDLIYAMPDMLIIVLLSVTLKRSLEELLGRYYIFDSLRTIGTPMIAMFIVFSLLYWVSMARIVRTNVLSLMQQEFIIAAKALGASNARILFRHLLPNSLGAIIVTATFQIPAAIYAESFLSFIGLGISAPRASLGSMVSDGLNGFFSYPTRLIFPSLLIALLILSFNVLGDALRDVLDPMTDTYGGVVSDK